MKPHWPSTNHFKRELARKALHLPAFLFPALALYSRSLAVGLLVLLLVFYVVFELRDFPWTRHLPQIKTHIARFKRSHHIDPAPAYLALGFLLCLLISTPAHTFYAAYVIAICDSAAALVGTAFGRHKIGTLSKSWEGSLTFFVLCVLGGFVFAMPTAALLSALLLTIVEMFSTQGRDNLLLPLCSQLLFLFATLG